MTSHIGVISAPPEDVLKAAFFAALQAVDPLFALPPLLPMERPAGRTLVIGAGKAAAKMAEAVEKHWGAPVEGMVITRYGHGADCRTIRVIEAGHPQPDEAGTKAAQHMLDLVRGLTEDDLVLCLISGGGSALMTLPPPGIPLTDKQALNRALLSCGASIGEINCVRRHISAIKGGRLAAACGPARVMTFVLSDVPGDDPAQVASGPTIIDTSSPQDALSILKRHRVEVSKAILDHLSKPAETLPPREGDEVFVIATAQQALEAAAASARSFGVTPLILSNCIEGEAREVGMTHAGIALQVRHANQPVARPALVLSGGETTVTVNGEGRGGRNVEFLLGAALGLDGADDIWALACDTDGVDGTEDNAGARIGPKTLRCAAEYGMNARQYLERNDAYSYFEKLGDLIFTGPTRTNVNDFRAFLIL